MCSPLLSTHTRARTHAHAHTNTKDTHTHAHTYTKDTHTPTPRTHTQAHTHTKDTHTCTHPHQGHTHMHTPTPRTHTHQGHTHTHTHTHTQGRSQLCSPSLPQHVSRCKDGALAFKRNQLSKKKPCASQLSGDGIKIDFMDRWDWIQSSAGDGRRGVMTCGNIQVASGVFHTRRVTCCVHPPTRAFHSVSTGALSVSAVILPNHQKSPQNCLIWSEIQVGAGLRHPPHV